MDEIMNIKIHMRYGWQRDSRYTIFMRWIAVVIMIFAAEFLCPVFSWAAIPTAPASFYAADYADVLSSETENRILSESAALEDACGAQIVVVTVDFTDGMDIEDYAYKLFNSWEIGSADHNDGLLILLVPGEENYWVMQGKGLESSLSSGRIQTILDTYMEPYFASEDYDNAVLKSYEQFYAAIAGIYGLSADDLAAGSRNDSAEKFGGGDYGDSHRNGYKTVILVVILLFFLCVAALCRPSRRARRYDAWGARRGYRPPRRNPPPMSGHGPVPPPPGGPHPAPPRRRRSSGGGSSTSSRSGGGRRSTSSRSGGSIPSSRSGGGGSTRGGGAGRK